MYTQHCHFYIFLDGKYAEVRLSDSLPAGCRTANSIQFFVIASSKSYPIGVPWVTMVDTTFDRNVHGLFMPGDAAAGHAIARRPVAGTSRDLT